MRSLSAPSQMSPRCVQQTIYLFDKETQSSRHQKLTCSTHKYLTNITLPPPSHTHTYTCAHAHTCTHTHTCTHIFPRLLKACSRELKSTGVWGRKKRRVFSWDLKADKGWVFSWDLKADKVWACRTEKGKLFQMEGPAKEKAHCPWNFLCLFGIWKMRVSAMERRVRDGLYCSTSRRSNR